MASEVISRSAIQSAAILAKHLERALSSVGLSLSQYRLLVFLSEKPEAASVLAKRLSVSRPSLTSLVDGLVAKGLVERETDPADRRRVSHTISEVGRARIEEADQAISTKLLAKIDGFATQDDIAKMVEGLEIWGSAIKAARAAARETQ